MIEDGDGEEALTDGVEGNAANDAPKAKNPLFDIDFSLKRRVIRNPQPKLNPERILGPKGVGALEGVFSDFKFRGKGREFEDLDEMLKRYEHWAHRLFPKLPFKDVMARIAQLGKKKEVKVNVKKIRLGMKTSFDRRVEDEEEKDQEETPGFDDEFDRIIAEMGDGQEDGQRAPEPADGTEPQRSLIPKSVAPNINKNSSSLAPQSGSKERGNPLDFLTEEQLRKYDCSDSDEEPLPVNSPKKDLLTAEQLRKYDTDSDEEDSVTTQTKPNESNHKNRPPDDASSSEDDHSHTENKSDGPDRKNGSFVDTSSSEDDHSHAENKSDGPDRKNESFVDTSSSEDDHSHGKNKSDEPNRKNRSSDDTSSSEEDASLTKNTADVSDVKNRSFHDDSSSEEDISYNKKKIDKSIRKKRPVNKKYSSKENVSYTKRKADKSDHKKGPHDEDSSSEEDVSHKKNKADKSIRKKRPIIKNYSSEEDVSFTENKAKDSNPQKRPLSEDSSAEGDNFGGPPKKKNMSRIVDSSDEDN